MKWYIHRFRNVYAKGVSTEITVVKPGQEMRTRWVRAVCLPYTDGSLLAAWEVFRGRAFAFEWPKPGELEKIVEEE